MVITAVTLAENRTAIHNISWQTFKAMLADMGDNRSSRLAYDNGVVEIMAPHMPHESSNRLIDNFVIFMCEELGLEVRSAGSLTLTRDDLHKGAEPDSSFYIKNESLVRNKIDIDLNILPPPDLVLEVEYSSPKIDKLFLYAAMGIPEFWRYNGSLLRVYILQNQQYSEVELSQIFAPVPVKDIPRFIHQSREIGQISVNRNFRAWVRKAIAQP
jgi:Uma2 family endonuclease